MRDRINGTAGWLRIACAVALLCAGFVHMPPLAGEARSFPAELAQYAFPDGTVPVLCLPGDGRGAPGDAGDGCAACRLNVDFAVPTPGGMTAWLLPRLERGAPPAPSGTVGPCPVPANASPRAPPAVRAA